MWRTSTPKTYTRSLGLRRGPAVVTVRDDPAGACLVATLRPADLRDYGQACAVLRRTFDLDADPATHVDRWFAGLLEQARPWRSYAALHLWALPRAG